MKVANGVNRAIIKRQLKTCSVQNMPVWPKEYVAYHGANPKHETSLPNSRC